MRKIPLLLLVFILTICISAFTNKIPAPDDPVYYWNNYTGSTSDPVVTVVLLSDVEAQSMQCSGTGYKCLVKLDEQLHETDVVYQRGVE